VGATPRSVRSRLTGEAADRPAAGGHDPDADGVERGAREDASDENSARSGQCVLRRRRSFTGTAERRSRRK
jgi:hypothetical protein